MNIRPSGKSEFLNLLTGHYMTCISRPDGLTVVIFHRVRKKTQERMW